MKLFILLSFLQLACCAVNFDPIIACSASDRPHVIDEYTAIVWSPLYDSDYPPNSTCEWLFTTDTEEVIGISWNDFSLENCIDCRCDYVEFYDGTDDTAPFLGRYCGNEPLPLSSSGNELFMRFISDADQQFSGFQAEATLVTPGCGDGKPYIVRDASGNISSSGYPESYPPSQDCGWRFEAPTGTRVQLHIEDLETEDCCNCDTVDVYDGPDFYSLKLGSWYDNDVPPIILSTSNSLYVEFWSDFSSSDFRGFFASYQHVTDTDEN